MNKGVTAIFKEMEKLAEEMDENFNQKGFEVTKETIQKMLDDWVKRRVVRFSHHKVMGKPSLASYRESLLLRSYVKTEIAAEMLPEVIEMAGIPEINDEERTVDLTFYMIPCKEVF